MEQHSETPPPHEERPSGSQVDWKRLVWAFGVCGLVVAAALLFDACG